LITYLLPAAMTSNRPYMIRALYEWITDNRMTPHLLVDATHPQAVVPARFIQDGKVVLNISPTAVRALVLGNGDIEFGARFGGVAMEVRVPVGAVLGVYARENGHGILFPGDEPWVDDVEEMGETEDELTAPEPLRKRPVLKVVK